MFTEESRQLMGIIITTVRLFSLGRNLGAAILVLTVAFIVCIRWWYLNIPTHVLGQFEPRWISTLEIAPTLAGCIAIAMVAPIVPITDIFAAPWPRKMSVLFAFLTATAAFLCAPLAILVLHLIPRNYIPHHEMYLLDQQPFSAVADFPYVISVSLNTATIVGLSMVMIALLGRHWGLLASIILYGAVIVFQSSPSASWLPLAGSPGWEHGAFAVRGVIALLSTSLGLVTWFFTRAAAPLTRRGHAADTRG